MANTLEVAIEVPPKTFKYSDRSKRHGSKGVNPHYILNQREFNDAIKKIDRQMLTLDFSEMDHQSKKIAEKLRCSSCNTLPASLRLMECSKCASVICEQCNDKMLDRFFGDSDTDDQDDIFENSSHGLTINSSSIHQD